MERIPVLFASVLISMKQNENCYLLSCALHDLYGDGVDFVMHLHRSPLPAANLYQKHPEVCPAEIQSEEITVLCFSRKICH